MWRTLSASASFRTQRASFPVRSLTTVWIVPKPPSSERLTQPPSSPATASEATVLIGGLLARLAAGAAPAYRSSPRRRERGQHGHRACALPRSPRARERASPRPAAGIRRTRIRNAASAPQQRGPPARGAAHPGLRPYLRRNSPRQHKTIVSAWFSRFERAQAHERMRARRPKAGNGTCPSPDSGAATLSKRQKTRGGRSRPPGTWPEACVPTKGIRSGASARIATGCTVSGANDTPTQHPAHMLQFDAAGRPS